MCDGSSMKMHLPKGDYQVRVNNFGGDADGHKQIWKLRSFATDSGVTMVHQDNYRYVYNGNWDQ